MGKRKKNPRVSDEDLEEEGEEASPNRESAHASSSSAANEKSLYEVLVPVV